MAVALLEHEARGALERYGISNVPGGFCKTKNEAIAVAQEIGYPVVLKIVSKDVVHKSDAGGVKLDLIDENTLSLAWDSILDSVTSYAPNAVIEGMLVTKMVKGAKEIIVGAINDSQFGPCIMTGLGGIFVEVFKDISFGIAPVNKREAEKMLKNLKSYPILAGARGEKAVNLDTLIQLLVQTSLYAYDTGVLEMDLNPVFCIGDEVLVGDARILLPDSTPQ
jgi:acetyl-CoA synthetase (ADP-forming)